jgi:hypothetical protein
MENRIGESLLEHVCKQGTLRRAGLQPRRKAFPINKGLSL